MAGSRRKGKCCWKASELCFSMSIISIMCFFLIILTMEKQSVVARRERDFNCQLSALLYNVIAFRLYNRAGN